MRFSDQKKPAAHPVGWCLSVLILIVGCLLASISTAQSGDSDQRFIPPPMPQDIVVPADDELQSYDQLPLEIRRELNRPQLSILSYSDIPDERYAMVNGFRGYEGLPVGRELWIHTIRPDGVVMRVQDQFFLLKR